MSSWSQWSQEEPQEAIRISSIKAGIFTTQFLELLLIVVWYFILMFFSSTQNDVWSIMGAQINVYPMNG